MIIMYILIYVLSVIYAYKFFIDVWKNNIVSTKTMIIEILLCFIPILNTFVAIIYWYINTIIDKTKRRL
jgi:hypothetical protein